ncbi:hypothetical protein [Prescottella agglutinans]|uniref:hypothetical protein n=1 Tax=Prescottella agglutinans TaxID=1644129 RepID=UPI003D986039
MSDKRSTIDRMERQNPVPPHSNLEPPAGSMEQILAHSRERSESNHDARRRYRPILVAASVVLVAGATVGGVLVVGDRSGSTAPGSPPSASFALPPTDPDLTVLPPPTAPEGATPTAPLLHFVAYTQAVSAKDLLLHLADRARRQPPARGTGPYEFMQTQGWFLSSVQTAEGTVLGWDTAVIDREQWGAEDGSRRIVDTENGVARSDNIGPARLPGDQIGSDESSAEVLRERLLVEGDGRSTQQWFTAFTDTWTTRIVPPNLQAAFLSVLAEQQDLAVLGAVTDRVGRHGVAISTETHERRLVLVFDETTGALLDYEQIALTPTAVSVPVALPSTVSYTVWLDRGYVDSVGNRP